MENEENKLEISYTRDYHEEILQKSPKSFGEEGAYEIFMKSRNATVLGF